MWTQPLGVARNHEVTPLYIAAQGGHVEVVVATLERRLCTLQLRKTMQRHGHLDVLHSLLDASANMDQRDNQGVTPLFTAAEHGNHCIVQALVAARADLEEATVAGATPLLVACRTGHRDITGFLLQARANAERLWHGIATWCPSRNECKVVITLLDAGVAAVGREQPPPLCLAAQKGHHQASCGVFGVGTAAKVGPGGAPAIFIAAQCGHVDLVHALLDASASIDLSDASGLTALHAAAKSGHFGAVQCLIEAAANCLLEAGAEKNQRMEDGLTPLHVASSHGHLQIVNELLLAGADCDSADDSGATALQYAAQEGAAQMVARLLSGGADANKAAYGGCSPLHAASDEGHLQVIRQLVLARAKIDSCTTGASALHSAVEKGHIAEMNASHSLRCNDGLTPLATAAGHGNVEMVRCLLNAKASLQDGLALHIATDRGHLAVVK
eukprot:Skav222834  [mRNA]  locus=scaffold1338:115917:131271:- [translate_table: standard]